MKKVVLLALCSILFSVISLSQSWSWGKGGYGSLQANDEGSPVATDEKGNVYVAGDYVNSISFGTHTLSCPLENFYLIKYDSTGNFLWITQPVEGANSEGFVTSIDIDKSGNILVTGAFIGTISFRSFSLSANYPNSESVFLVKYSPTGSVIWAKQANTKYSAAGYSVATDKLANIIVVGEFQGSILFGYDTLTTSPTGYDMFITKFDSLGNVLWAGQANIFSASDAVVGNSVNIDNNGNVYVSGYFYDTVSFTPYKLISANGYSAFLAKYAANGNIVWVKQSVNSSYDGFGEGTSVTTDQANNIYTTGYFNDIIRFDANILYSPSSYSIFFTKYDTNGNILWVKQSSIGWMGSAIASDKHNDIYLGGVSYYNDDTLRFGNYILRTSPWVSYASFLMKFDTSGEPICGSMLENLGYNSQGVEIASDPQGNYTYISGTFANDTLICGADTSSSNNGNINPFVGRWLNCNEMTGINPIVSLNSSDVLFPNPNDGRFTLNLHLEQDVTSSPTIEIYNSIGEKIFSEILHTVQGNNSITISNEPNGLYLYRVITGNGNLIGEGKMIIEH